MKKRGPEPGDYWVNRKTKRVAFVLQLGPTGLVWYHYTVPKPGPNNHGMVPHVKRVAVPKAVFVKKFTLEETS